MTAVRRFAVRNASVCVVVDKANMSTRGLAFGGVMCALGSVCVILSTLFHIISPLIIASVFFCLSAKKGGVLCGVLVVITANIIGFFVGGVGGGEILFSVLLFSPLSIIVSLTSGLDKGISQFVLRAVILAAFSVAVYALFATALREIVGMEDEFGLGVYAFGAIWTVILTVFGFALDKGAAIILKRFAKDD